MPVCEHLVQFYDTEDELLSAVVPYLASGLDSGEAVIVIASESHRLAFERRIAAADPAGAATSESYTAIDAEQVLAYVLDTSDGAIGSAEFEATIGKLVRSHLRSGRPLRVYSEIVALLWDHDEPRQALVLEELWNTLRGEAHFTLFCGYPGAVAPAEPEMMWQVCRSHSCVLPVIADADLRADAAPLRAEFMPTINAPARVRKLLRTRLGELHCDEDLIERGALTASELAANAVLHAHTPFRLLIEPRNESVWIAVEDEQPLAGRFDVIGRSPHGLGLIAALSRRWGVAPYRRGKVVWAELPR